MHMTVSLSAENRGVTAQRLTRQMTVTETLSVTAQRLTRQMTVTENLGVTAQRLTRQMTVTRESREPQRNNSPAR